MHYLLDENSNNFKLFEQNINRIYDLLCTSHLQEAFIIDNQAYQNIFKRAEFLALSLSRITHKMYQSVDLEKFQKEIESLNQFELRKATLFICKIQEIDEQVFSICKDLNLLLSYLKNYETSSNKEKELYIDEIKQIVRSLKNIFVYLKPLADLKVFLHCSACNEEAFLPETLNYDFYSRYFKKAA